MLRSGGRAARRFGILLGRRRARTGHAPENCSSLRKIALMLLRRNAIDGMGVGPMRKECAWDFDSARKVFLGGEGKEVAA